MERSVESPLEALGCSFLQLSADWPHHLACGGGQPGLSTSIGHEAERYECQSADSAMGEGLPVLVARLRWRCERTALGDAATRTSHACSALELGCRVSLLQSVARDCSSFMCTCRCASGSSIGVKSMPSEMCRRKVPYRGAVCQAPSMCGFAGKRDRYAVSYTHLTLPTKA